MSNDEMVQRTQEFVEILCRKEECVVKCINTILERKNAGFELAIKRQDISAPYRREWEPTRDFLEGKEP